MASCLPRGRDRRRAPSGPGWSCMLSQVTEPLVAPSGLSDSSGSPLQSPWGSPWHWPTQSEVCFPSVSRHRKDLQDLPQGLPSCPLSALPCSI